jgi:hypothetical protein
LLIYKTLNSDESLYNIVYTPSLYEELLAAVIELKWYGNWDLRDLAKAVGKDVWKIDRWMTKTTPPTPGISLVFGVVAWPTMKDKMYHWLEKQIAKDRIGVRTEEEVMDRLKQCDGRFQHNLTSPP